MLKFLDLNKFSKGLNPVTSAEIFSRPNEFNADGLFSERIFGNLESQERRKIFSYIDLHTKIIHPSALKIILQLNRKIDHFISASENFILNSNGDLIQDPDGELTGLSKFIEIFPDIKFRGETETREKFIELLHKSYKEGTLFIDKVPIIPPDFRPAFQEEDGNWMIDKMNDVYQSMIRKAIQVRSSGGSGILFDLLSYGLQLAVVEHDKFIRTKVEKKNGLIRSQMLGKRIDFSGRAVITPGPNLKINEVGVPFRIAINLFEPFIMHVLLHTNRVNREELSSEIKKFIKSELSVDSIRRIIKAVVAGDKLPLKLHKMLWDVTELVMKNRVVICKRDPVLHMSSVRAFHPVLVEGDTLQICVLQVGGFNADFDGDQMAIYTPLTDEAQEEVRTRMMRLEASDSSKSFIFALSKDMYAGLYLMTKDISYSRSPIVVSEKDLETAVDPYIPVRYRGEVTTMGRAILNSALPKDFPFIKDVVNKKVATKIISKLVEKYDKEVIIESVSKLSKMGFKFATIIAPTLTLDDVEVPKEIYDLKDKLVGADTETADNIIQQMKVILEKHLQNTGLHDLIESGAGKGWTQPLQILCAKGVIADTKGNILAPIRGSFAEGLTPIEFFKAAPGARKGLADRVLNTATTGYMARKLSYVLNPVEADLYLKDCGTNRTITIKLDSDMIGRLNGRYIIKNGKVIPFNPDDFAVGDVVRLRTPIYCISPKICHTCYGDLLKRHKSPFIGIIASQILGEVNTQAIMRTFHTGGVVKVKKKEMIKDILSNDPLIELK
jgi:DNA-directed RNA polymerase subunit beta'